MDSQINFNRLVGRLRMKHFDFLNRLGQDPNLGRVAVKMNMAQPTASKLLSELENIFEAKLFVRNRRGMTPTPEGVSIIRRAGLMLADLHAAHEEFISVSAGGVGRVRLGVFPVAVPRLLPGLIASLQKQWPRISIAVEEGDETSLMSRLSEGKIDCVLGRIVTEIMTSELVHEVLYYEPTVIVASPDHPAVTAGKDECIRLLSTSNWILPQPGGASHKLVSSRLALGGQPAPHVLIESISVIATLEMLQRDNMLSVLPLGIAESYAVSGSLAIVPINLSETRYPVGIVFRKDSQDAELSRVLLHQSKLIIKKGEYNRPV